jgi:hypothetical protein
MNNPGIDLKIWEQLRKKWADLDSKGHQIKVEFKLITDPKDENSVLIIDVVQNIDNEPITETVQRVAKEAYTQLGIADVSLERLIEIYMKTMQQLHNDIGQRDATLIVTMSPTSPTSGEVRAALEKADHGTQESILINYRHYYILNAMREKMMEKLGDEWRQVRAVYQRGELEFYFEYLP